MNNELIEELRRSNRLTLALLALYVRDYETRASEAAAPRIELVLAASGLGYQEIAALTGKKSDAVRMLLVRNKDVIKNL